MRSLLLALVLTGCAHSQPQVARLAELKTIAGLGKALEDPNQPPSARLEIEWQLAQALERAGLLNLAFLYSVSIERALKHPHRVDAVRSLIRSQEPRHDDLLVPAILKQMAEGDQAPELPPEETARLAWLRARIAFRIGKLQDVVSMCTSVPAQSPVFARCEYLRALALSDERLNSGAGTDEAIAILERLAQTITAAHENGDGVRAQTLLALGRLAYRQQRWRNSVLWYRQAAKIPSVRARALVEQSSALLRLEEWDGALALLTRDEVRDSAIPEAPLMEALAWHYAGRWIEVEAAMVRALAHDFSETVDWKTASAERALKALRTESGIAAGALKIFKTNLRLQRLLSSIGSFEAELETVNRVELWKESGLGARFARFLRLNLEALEKAAGHLALMELRSLQTEKTGTRDRLLMLGVEASLARKDVEFAIQRLESVLAKLPDTGPATSDTLFRLAALKQARAELLQGADAEEAKAEVALLIKRVLEGDASYERLEEARRFLDPG
jgi:hypothetical protein